MSDNKVATIHLGDVIYADIDSNEYLREIHDNLLYNYAAKMLNIFDQTSRPVDRCPSICRFAVKINAFDKQRPAQDVGTGNYHAFVQHLS